MPAFNVQHINDYDVPAIGGSQTLSAVNMEKCVVINTNNFMMSGGLNGSVITQPLDEASLGIDLTSSTNVNFARQAAAITTTRAHASAWEYTGNPGGPNEFLVRSRGSVSMSSATRTTTATCTTTPTDIHKCVVFITGISVPGTSNAQYDDATCVSWLSGTNTINFERGGANLTTTIYYTVVEFTGSNWKVHHGFSGDVATATGTINLFDQQKGAGTASTVAAWNKAFIYGLFKADDNSTNYNVADLWPVLQPGATTGQVDWTFDAATYTGVDNQHLVYVVENSDTNFSVARHNSTAITLPANDHTQAITAVTLSEAFALCTCETAGSGAAFGRGMRSAHLNSTVQAASYNYRSGNNGQIEYQIMNFSNMSEGNAANAIFFGTNM